MNDAGEDEAGNTFLHMASPDAVEAGYAINTPVVVRYPDGTLAPGFFVGITESGLEFLRGYFESGIARTFGSA